MFKGHPILGGFFGLLFGVFVALDLTFFKVTPLSTVVLVACLVGGRVLGLAVAAVGPIGRRRGDG